MNEKWKKLWLRIVVMSVLGGKNDFDYSQRTETSLHEYVPASRTRNTPRANAREQKYF